MNIKNILVALDLSSLDSKLIAYAASLTQKLPGVEKVYFVHNIKKYEFSELFQESTKELDLETMVEKKLDAKVAEHFTQDTPYEILISDDRYTESLINYVTNKYQINLVMVGNKNTYKGSGSISGKLLRMLKCDVLSIPENYTFPPQKILTTTDFSVKSKKGVAKALAYQELFQAHLSCLNVYKIPAHYFPVLNLDKVKTEIEKHVGKSMTKMFAKFQKPQVEPLIIRAGDLSVPERIGKIAEDRGFDLLFIADKGHNNFTSLFVGSTTEELFTHYLNVPLWVVKNG